MIRQILVAFILVSIDVSIHATGMVELMNWLMRKRAKIEKAGTRLPSAGYGGRVGMGLIRKP